MRLIRALKVVLLAFLASGCSGQAADSYPALPADDGIYALHGGRWVELEMGRRGPYVEPAGFPVVSVKPVLAVIGIDPNSIQARNYDSWRRGEDIANWLPLRTRRVSGGAIITFRDGLTPGKYVVHGVYGNNPYVVGFEMR